eukprot:RCo036411
MCCPFLRHLFLILIQLITLLPTVISKNPSPSRIRLCVYTCVCGKGWDVVGVHGVGGGGGGVHHSPIFGGANGGGAGTELGEEVGLRALLPGVLGPPPGLREDCGSAGMCVDRWATLDGDTGPAPRLLIGGMCSSPTFGDVRGSDERPVSGCLRELAPPSPSPAGSSTAVIELASPSFTMAHSRRELVHPSWLNHGWAHTSFTVYRLSGSTVSRCVMRSAASGWMVSGIL